MSAADFLLSPTVQAILKVVFAEPVRPFSAEELARLTKLEVREIEAALAHLADSGVLAQGATAGDSSVGFHANTSFVFYAEFRRIAFKSFAGAEPLRAMLRARFRGQVERAFLLGEDAAVPTLSLLIVHGDAAPEKAELEQALQKLVKTRALSQHVQALVMSTARFNRLQAGDALHAQLAADTCIDISPPPRRQSARVAKPADKPIGLLEKTRRRLAGFAR